LNRAATFLTELPPSSIALTIFSRKSIEYALIFRSTHHLSIVPYLAGKRCISEAPNLIIIINTSDDVDSVLENQKKFDENYWLTSPLNITKNIIISFDFK